MIPVRLEVTNFLAYRSPAPLDFSGIHVAVLCGENGAGKSSLLDAITWAVWGRARSKTDQELVHQGQTEMRVEFTFLLASQLYRILRARRVGRGATSLLDFQVSDGAGQWRSIAEATIPKTQEKIIRTLHLSFDTFTNSAYLVQGQADEFTGKRPTERKQVLADILGLQEWDRYEERARDRMRALDLRLAGIDEVLREIDAELGRRADYERDRVAAQARVIEVSERLRQAEAGWTQVDLARQARLALDRQITDLARRLKETEREIGALDADLREAQLRADTTAVRRELEVIERQVADLAQLDTEREGVQQARGQIAELAAQRRGENEAAHTEADLLKKRIDTLSAASEPLCPTCGQPLAEAARAELVARLSAEVEARRSQYRDNQAQLKKWAEEQAALDRWLAQTTTSLRGQAALLRRQAELQAALDGAGEAQERITGLTERRARWAAALEADRGERARLLAEAEQHDRVLRDAEAKQRALDQLRQEDTFAKAALGAAEQRLAALEGLDRQRESKRAERQALAEERGLFEELREAFGKRGVPALMIEAAVPEIEAAANTLLARMTAGRMHVRFNTQRETQAGDVRETLDIHIADELGTRAYENFSGGEQFRVDFAIRVALSQLLARRAGTQLQTLIMDEGFGVLDAAGRERLVEAINAAQHDFQRILVVTHIDELKDAFPARIEITKGPDGSEIAVR